METSFTTPENNNNRPFSQQVIDAAIQVVYPIVYFLFLLPYGLWKNAVVRMSNQKQSHALDVTNIKSEWPFLSWLKRFVFEFVFDALIVIWWLIGLILFAIGGGFSEGFIGILFGLYGIYFAPITISIMRDCATLFVVLPIRWLISFLRRPAKTYDLTHVGKIER